MSTTGREDLAARLGSALGRPVEVAFTRNRSRLVSWRSAPGGLVRLRLHEVFAELAPAELACLADLLAERPGSRARMRGVVEARRELLQARARPRAPALEPIGRFHDLSELRDELLAALFPRLEAPPIGWSGRAGRARRRLRLGSWDATTGVVRIHRRLDADDVPRFFVASIVNHELCHAALGEPEVVGGRRRLHGPEFTALERRFEHAARAAAWEEEHRAELFRAAPEAARRRR